MTKSIFASFMALKVGGVKARVPLFIVIHSRVTEHKPLITETNAFEGLMSQQNKK